MSIKDAKRVILRSTRGATDSVADALLRILLWDPQASRDLLTMLREREQIEVGSG
jgi:hypothetical protein